MTINLKMAEECRSVAEVDALKRLLAEDRRRVGRLAPGSIGSRV
jgi:hypothetical protein